VSVTVLRTGPLAVFKDHGRPGHAHQGVAPSGAADREAYRRANALVGNAEGAAALECTLGGLRLRFDTPGTVVLTGTDAVLTVDGTKAGAEEVVSVPAGATVTVGMPRAGLRSYLAVRGGFDVPMVLGSRSTDRIAGIGPARPSPGDVLPIGFSAAPQPDISDSIVFGASPDISDSAALGAPDAVRAGASCAAGDSHAASRAAGASGGGVASGGASGGGVASGEVSGGGVRAVELEVELGPREDWFTAAAIETLFGEEYSVTPASDSVGLRLDGPALTRARHDELPSEGVVRGAIQVPPDGKPIVFQSDHPVTGGYPVIAVLTPRAADLAAQARPGARLRFRPA
jgi:allophanate hydrolase subunit 2